MILTTLAKLRLAPLGDYGGSTETIALLPGSLAVAVGMAVSGVTTDSAASPSPLPGYRCVPDSTRLARRQLNHDR